MENKKYLGKSNLLVPRLGVGVMTWGEAKGLTRLNPAKLAYGGSDSREAEKEAMVVSLAADVNLFDTAAMYSSGASEKRLGELAQGKDVLISTKFPPGLFSRAEDMPQALEQSLIRLKRETIDLYQHHFPSNRVAIPKLMEFMANAVKDGKIRAVGVSNYSVDQMRLAHKVLADHGVPLASNQVQYSLLHRKPETNGVIDACRELGITLIAYQPLASGALTGKYLKEKPRGIRRFMGFFNNKNLESISSVISLLNEIGNRHYKTPAQVALRWLIENDLVLPIPGAKNGKQAASNAETLTFSLEQSEIDELNQITTKWRN